MASVIFGHIMKIKENSSVLTAMPLYHSTAAMLGVCPTLIVGGCVTVSQNSRQHRSGLKQDYVEPLIFNTLVKFVVIY